MRAEMLGILQQERPGARFVTDRTTVTYVRRANATHCWAAVQHMYVAGGAALMVEPMKGRLSSYGVQPRHVPLAGSFGLAGRSRDLHRAAITAHVAAPALGHLPQPGAQASQRLSPCRLRHSLVSDEAIDWPAGPLPLADGAALALLWHASHGAAVDQRRVVPVHLHVHTPWRDAERAGRERPAHSCVHKHPALP